MKAAGFTLGGKDHPICPIMVGDAKLTSIMADEMLEKGKLLSIIMSPPPSMGGRHFDFVRFPVPVRVRVRVRVRVPLIVSGP